MFSKTFAGVSDSRVNCLPSEMSVKSILRSSYGPAVTTVTTAYQRCLEKLARHRNHVVFNARCKRERIIPESLKIRPPVDTVQGRKIAERAGHQFVNERLRLANYRVRHLEEERKWREIGLRRRLSEEDATRVLEMSQVNTEIVFKKTREHQKQKLERLLRREVDDQKTVRNSRWVVNLSNHTLTDPEQDALQKGPNFAIAPGRIPKTEIIAGVEAAIRRCKHVDEEVAEKTRATIASVIRRAQPPRRNMGNKELEALDTLRGNREITILQADKGNATVILNTSDYERKAHAILDHYPFQRVARDRTARTEKRVNETLKRMSARGEIDNATVMDLRISSNGTRTPLFYGTVKIHKPDFPLRPIVSTIGSATYNIAKFISRTLTPYVKDSPSFIENTPHFIEEIRDLRIDEDELMVSFDVKSLFTTVPIQEATETIEEVLAADENLTERTGVTAKTVMELIKLCLSTTYFRFRNNSYQLTDGLPMGSPASPAIANMFMNKLEQTALATFVHRPRVWLRYVDDVFSIVKKTRVEELLKHLNSQHPSIQFTVEVETENRLPFLDVTVHRVGNALELDVYRKPTNTGRYLHYESNHPESAKKAVVRSLIDRIRYVTKNDPEAKETERARIHDDLTANGYPNKFVKQTTRHIQNPRPPTQAPQRDIHTTATIPYIRGLSEAVSRVLTPLGIRTVMKPTTLKWSLMARAKDNLPAEDTPGAIYALGCTDCPKVYIGETGRTAKQRAREHKCHTRTGHTELSAVARHAHTEGHNIHWKPRVIASENKTTNRKIKEALAINKLEKERGSDKVMNQDKGTELRKIWLNLV